MKITMFFLSIICLSGCFMQRIPNAIEKRDAQKLVDKGTALLLRERLDEAQAAYEVAWDVAPIASAIDGLGCVALARGEYDKAERYFNQARQVDPSYTNVLGNLALLYEIQGKHNQAKVLYQDAVILNPKNYRVRNNFAAFMYDYLGKGSKGKAAARAELERARALERDKIIEDNIKRLENSDG